MRWWLGTKAANDPVSIGFKITEKAEEALSFLFTVG